MRRIFFLVILCMALIPMVMAGNPNSEEQTAAGKTIQHYFNALKRGDVNSLKSLMGGELLKKRLILLKNPTYPQYLRNTYQDATLKIVETRFIAQGHIAIIAEFNIGNQQTLCREFHLARNGTKDQAGFRIFSETTHSGSN